MGICLRLILIIYSIMGLLGREIKFTGLRWSIQMLLILLHRVQGCFVGLRGLYIGVNGVFEAVSRV